jgi:hypothetical protein
MNIPKKRMITSMVMNIPQEPRPRDIRLLVITCPQPALKKAPVKRLAATAINTIMAVTRIVT